jgi:hypothetical protein
MNKSNFVELKEFIVSIRHKYDYDKRGNWIKQIYFANKERPQITERKIEYYSSKPQISN